MAFRFTQFSKPHSSNMFDFEGLSNGLGAATLDSKDRVIIALDFGTTDSGVAYCFCNSTGKPDVRPVVDWVGLEGRTQPKVPTAVLYDPKDNTKFKWGGQLTWRDHHVQGVKLLLDPKQTRPSYLPSSNAKSEIRRLPKDVVDVVADFMKAMYDHALEKIGSKVPRDYLDLCEKSFVLSVPAVWSDKAKERTIQNKTKGKSAGDCFVVCDAGGGTVDLISYEVVSTKPTLDLAELVPGKGNMSGSLGLNKRFTEAVRDLIGDEEWFRLKGLNAWALAERQFDQEIKTGFTGDLDDEFVVNFPGARLKDSVDEGLERDSWFMSGEAVHGIFEPLIVDIIRLVDDQVQGVKQERPDNPIKGIFLVGGFGSSQYLKTRIEKANPTIQVIQPEDAWAAIVKGAALSRLPYTNVISTKATRHYGVSSWSIYEPAIDKGRPTSTSEVTGQLRAERMTWYIVMGETLRRDRNERYTFHRHIPKSHSEISLRFQDNLWMSEALIQPQHPTSDVKLNCVLNSDLNSVDKSLFKEEIGHDGREWLRVEYQLVISTRDAAMKFWLEFDGKEAGSILATYA
ncbi:Hsp70 family heat shock protein [Fusarium beomiforme]|uniref:Hsp70 family heat shock protein n=1 Tax=Fusarium beomiforme TaxID=44412 RepID=A0A9P5DSL0_9HYPO|nr:Hsp70 family heat shock protein [Fusarium beomiforme]